MNTMKYLLIGVLIALSGTAFCAELPKPQEEVKTSVAALSSEEQEKLTKGLHESRTKEEAEEWIGKGAQTGTLLVTKTDSDQVKVHRTFLCSAVLNPLAHEELVEFIISRQELPPFGEMRIDQFTKKIEKRFIVPLFYKLMGLAHVKGSQWNSLGLLQKKCIKLVDCGEQLDQRHTTIEKGESESVSEGDTFADAVSKNFDAWHDVMQKLERSNFKDRLMYILAMCTSIHTAGTKRSKQIKVLLPDALLRLPVALINTIIFEYVSDDAELEKIKTVLDNPRAEPLLKELAVLNEADAKKAAAESASA